MIREPAEPAEDDGEEPEAPEVPGGQQEPEVPEAPDEDGNGEDEEPEPEPRVTPEQVKCVITTKVEDISLFIETANLIIDEQLCDKGMTEARLKKIALYLSAHYVTLIEKQTKTEQFGSAREVYQGTTKMNLQSTFYGQTALQLDISGTLHNLGNQFAEVEVL